MRRFVAVASVISRKMRALTNEADGMGSLIGWKTSVTVPSVHTATGPKVYDPGGRRGVPARATVPVRVTTTASRAASRVRKRVNTRNLRWECHLTTALRRVATPPAEVTGVSCAASCYVPEHRRISASHEAKSSLSLIAEHC